MEEKVITTQINQYEKQNQVITRILTVGSGSSGILLAGHLDDITSLQEQELYNGQFNFDKQSNINEIDFDGMMAIAVDYEKNQIYKFGECYVNQQNKKEVQFKPQIINFSPQIQITNISCGWNHCIFYNKYDLKNIFGFGSNSFGELGLGAKNKTFFQETQILNLNFNDNNQTQNEITLGKCGFRQTFIIVNNKDLYITGQNKSFELGISKDSKDYGKGIIYDFIQNTNEDFIQNQEIEQIQLGYKFGGILSKNNEVFLWGDNKYGQISGEIKEKTVQKLVKLDEKVEQIKLGWHHVIYKKNDSNDIYLQGRNDMGQLGSPDTKINKNVLQFNQQVKNLDENEKIIDIAAGSECGYALTNKEKLYAWGWNEHGNLGNGNLENLLEPTLIKYNYQNDKQQPINKVQSRGAIMYLQSIQNK